MLNRGLEKNGVPQDCMKSVSAQLQREREANAGDVSNCDKPEESKRAGRERG